ncbi:MAG TPA: hypothetical protein VHO84_03255 [Syntrophorhabdaceae bacterium]|nr:hypothetical protein [Syntrophorhabdaceae bacterium]
MNRYFTQWNTNIIKIRYAVQLPLAIVALKRIGRTWLLTLKRGGRNGVLEQIH